MAKTNFAVFELRGKWIAMLHVDDLWMQLDVPNS